jgi:hypoxanthine phosphoribosyltransferase
MSTASKTELANPLKIEKTLFTAEQVQRRVTEIAKQISHDYAGKTLHVICVLENGFMFMADLVRQIEVPVICEFVLPQTTDTMISGTVATEIFFHPDHDVSGAHVLIVEALVQSGVTSEFLIRNLTTKGAATVKLAALLDKQAERRISLQPDYFGFLVDDKFVVGYGLGAPELGRNLNFIGTAAQLVPKP